MTDVVGDPDFPDLVGVVGWPLMPCKVVEFTATTAATTRVEGTDGLDAHYEHTRRYVIRYQPKPVEVTYLAGVSNEEIERARQAVLETVLEVTTGEPNAALYLTCQNHHPLALRTTAMIEHGARRGVHCEPVCPQCERDGITDVHLPDLDGGNDDG